MSLKLALPPAAIQQQYEEVSSSVEVGGKTFNLRLLKDVSFIPPLSQVTSASVVPVIRPGRIIATILERGPDIPGGHVETYDYTVERTIEREAYEEACIILTQPMYLIGIIASDYATEDATDGTYMLIAAGRVGHTDAFNASFESFGRKEMAHDEFLDQYRAGSSAMMRELIDRTHSLRHVLFG